MTLENDLVNFSTINKREIIFIRLVIERLVGTEKRNVIVENTLKSISFIKCKIKQV